MEEADRVPASISGNCILKHTGFEQKRNISDDPLAAEVLSELEAAYRRELSVLSDLAFVFLNATGGDRAAAERAFENAIDLLLEGGVLSLWRVRIVLDRIAEGL